METDLSVFLMYFISVCLYLVTVHYDCDMLNDKQSFEGATRTSDKP